MASIPLHLALKLLTPSPLLDLLCIVQTKYVPKRLGAQGPGGDGEGPMIAAGTHESVCSCQSEYCLHSAMLRGGHVLAPYFSKANTPQPPHPAHVRDGSNHHLLQMKERLSDFGPAGAGSILAKPEGVAPSHRLATAYPQTTVGFYLFLHLCTRFRNPQHWRDVHRRGSGRKPGSSSGADGGLVGACSVRISARWSRLIMGHVATSRSIEFSGDAQIHMSAV